MQFAKIWFDGVTVKLRYERRRHGNETIAFRDKDAPTPKFKDALQAFRPFATKLLGLDAWTDAEVRALSLTEKEGTRGLQVTLVRTITDARNRKVPVTTPHLFAPPAEYEGPGVGFLDDVTMKLIEVMEEQAEAYRNGERGEQTKLALGDENADRVDDRMRAASVASTRKPKKDKARELRIQAETGVEAANQAGDAMTDENLRQLLLSVERDVPVDAIARWSSSERDGAQRWAHGRQKELMGHADAKVRAEPECVLRDATMPLSADQWKEPTPPPRAETVVPIRAEEAADD